jgi:hypothetical protein
VVCKPIAKEINGERSHRNLLATGEGVPKVTALGCKNVLAVWCMGCRDCVALLEAFASATNAHIHQSGRLEIARIQHDYDAVPKLESTVDELRVQRERALMAYRTHQQAHESSPLPTRSAIGRGR